MDNSRMSLWKVTRPAVWASFCVVSRLYLLLSMRDYRFVFILGHMRSGSSLLAHLLADHPDIVGAGETHLSYRTAEDLSNLIVKTSELLRRPVLREAYLVDQINHPYVADEVLRSGRLYRCVILVREPEATIKSTMSMLKCPEQEALDVYTKQLDELIHYGRLLGGRALALQYDDLVDRTDATLAALTRFLGLTSPLTPHYATHRMTGRVEGYGDPSGNIKSGKIVRTAGHKILLSPDTLHSGTRAFDNCLADLHRAAVQDVSDATSRIEHQKRRLLNST